MSDTPISSEELRNRILGSMKKQFSGEQTSRWLANLDQLPEKLNPEGTLAPPAQEATLPVHVLADKLFDDFQRYAFEFNKNPVGTDLVVQVERPTPVRHSAPKRFGDQPVISQGHFLTRYFANVLKMYEHGIRAFVIPAENLVAFYGSDLEFTDYMQIEPVQGANGTVWKVGNETVTPQSLPNLSKRIFSALIKVATGEGPYNDPFNELEKAKANKAATAVPPPPSYRANESGFELRTGRTVAPGSPELLRAAQAATNGQGQYQGANRVATTGGRQDQPTAQPAAASTAGGAVQHLITDTNRLNQEILSFIQLLDEELNKLTQVGIQVLQAQDMDTMQKLMHRTTLLKNARDQISSLAEELNK
jgi:hypothetical protein